jgi:hypothetical protein
LRQHIRTDAIDLFLKPIHEDKLYEQDWFWLEPEDEGLHDACNFAEKFQGT